MGFLDLHIHVKNNSDNKSGQSIEDILREAIQNQTYTLAFTSHNTLVQYRELFETIKRLEKEDIDLYNQVINNMKFAIGLEINSRVDENTARDMLVYNIPIEKIDEVQSWLNKNTNRDVTAACQLEQLKHFKDTANRLNIPYIKNATIGEEQIYAGMVFATAVKNQIDEMLVDILTKESPIKDIFSRLLAQDVELQERINNSEDKKTTCVEILNDKAVLEKIPQIEQIKQLYYQILDLRLFASQSINGENEKTVTQTVKELEDIMKQEFETRNITKLDDESIKLINAELFSKFFDKDSEFFDVSEYLKQNNNKDAKQMKLALYYSIAEQIDTYIQSDETTKTELMGIQRALTQSKISFADILERLNWFNSELVRRNQKSPFHFNTNIFKPKVEDVVEEMHKVGAIVEVAHPFAYETDNIDNYLEICVNKGVDGIETFYCLPSTDEKEYDMQKKYIQEFCQKRGLICNHGGTDYHKKGIEEIGKLRAGVQVNEEKIASEIVTLPANEFMRQMEQVIEIEGNDR